MSLRLRLVLIVSLLVGGYAIAQFAIQGLLVAPRFQELEDARAFEVLERVQAEIAEELGDVDRACREWSAWDDTYEYIEKPYEAYEVSNLQDASLAGERINVLYASDVKGEVRIRRFFDLPIEPKEFPAGKVPEGDLLFRELGVSATRSGVLNTDAGMLAVACRPIVRSDEFGPMRGLVVVGRLFGPEWVAQVREATSLDFDLVPYSTTEPASEDLADIVDELSDGPERVTRPRADGGLDAWSVLRDVRGVPTLLVRATTRAVSARRTEDSRNLATGATLGAGLLILAFVIVLLRRTVAGPLSAFTAQVVALNRSGDLSRKIRITGHGEIGVLAREFNNMLERIAGQIQELGRANRMLSDAHSRAGAANRAKSEFLSNMSHEIRTPMTAILGYAELLADPTLTSEQIHENVAIVRRNGEHLLSIINDILDLSKIEAGALEIEKVPLHLGRLVGEVQELFSFRASEKGLELRVEVAADVPACVQSDPVRLKQMLVNLVGNAIKFTTTGSVTVQVRRLSKDDDDSVRLEFRVVDTGIGLSAEAAARLFQPFSQADTSTTRRFGGTGLGLSICRRLADLFGGAIDVTSQPGHGSTFRFDIKTYAWDGPLPEGRDPVVRRQAARLDGLRVLVAEDGRDNQRLFSTILTRAGAEVEIASDGREAVDRLMAQLAEGKQPDVVLMDMQMPELDGYAASRELRKRSYKGPIVAMTAHAMAGDRERCLESGCDEYLTKPVDRTALLEACARLGRKAPLPSAAPEMAVASKPRLSKPDESKSA